MFTEALIKLKYKGKTTSFRYNDWRLKHYDLVAANDIFVSLQSFDHLWHYMMLEVLYA
jgi:hypothetical protein